MAMPAATTIDAAMMMPVGSERLGHSRDMHRQLESYVPLASGAGMMRTSETVPLSSREQSAQMARSRRS
jgi:hypothetical protein